MARVRTSHKRKRVVLPNRAVGGMSALKADMSSDVRM